jgi:hypothetical protein
LHDVIICNVKATPNLNGLNIGRRWYGQKLIRHQDHQYLTLMCSAIKYFLDWLWAGIGIDPDMHNIFRERETAALYILQ